MLFNLFKLPEGVPDNFASQFRNVFALFDRVTDNAYKATRLKVKRVKQPCMYVSTGIVIRRYQLKADVFFFFFWCRAVSCTLQSRQREPSVKNAFHIFRRILEALRVDWRN